MTLKSQSKKIVDFLQIYLTFFKKIEFFTKKLFTFSGFFYILLIDREFKKGDFKTK